MKAAGAVALTAVAGGRPLAADRPREGTDHPSASRAAAGAAAVHGTEPEAVRQTSRTQQRQSDPDRPHDEARRHHEDLVVDSVPLRVVDVRSDGDRIAVERTQFEAHVLSFDPVTAGDLDPEEQRAALRGSWLGRGGRDVLIDPDRVLAPHLSPAGLGQGVYEPPLSLTGTLSDLRT